MENRRHHVVLWEFEVHPEKQEAFVNAHGPAGAWTQLFQRAHGYRDTLLLHDPSRVGLYLTIDRWSCAADYETFRIQFANEYAELDRACETLTLKERLLGSYEEIS